MKFFPGCMIHNRYPGIEKALYYVFEKLGIEISPLEGSSCCPAPSITRSVSSELWEELAQRNLKLADGETVITACNGCFTTLLEVSEKFGAGDVRHVAEFFYAEIGAEELKKYVEKRLPLKLAIHYGCHFFRPSKHKRFTSPERPKMLDELVEVFGAESVDYRYKFMCCGGGGGVRAGATEVSHDLLRKKMDGIAEAEVDAIAVICPLCMNQFDNGQKELRELGGEDYGIPVIHYVQLLAIAMGMDVEDTGLERHAIVSHSFIEKLVK
ncbi:heterodisulfide reductase-related iron-sulfur binding cluster [Geoglobus acetivorans]|uniref:CoB--CoM heterodisulfide reductase iron-sulfur subunit B family protein n=1 Tax=Geoglobus acetivorans TaxID=565033 RepID=A0ABZ3H3Z1_GEOAI|nr:CoB--CoM heterodisulfide reductase subunit B [Geoglobus acetivorans]